MTNLSINKSASFLAIMLLTNFAIAQDYPVPAQGPVMASVSDKGVNRIAIENDRIAQVIGNEDEYIIESDTNLGQIFLTPTLKAPQDISLRLVTEREKIIDAKFSIKKIEPQTINIKYKNDPNIALVTANPNLSSNPVANLNADSNDVQQIIENLKLVHHNNLQAIPLPALGCLKQNPKLQGLKLVEGSQYNLNKQLIVKANVSNTKSEVLFLNEADFSNCMSRVTAVVLNNTQLVPKTSTTVYLVGKDGK